VLERASAFAWYEGTKNEPETDRLVMATAKARPEDRATFQRAWGHFQQREAAGPYDPVKPGSPRVALQEIAAAQAKRALAAEEQEFAKGTDEMGAGGDRCLAQMEEAKKWLSEALLDTGPVVARAVRRGDSRAAGASLVELVEADRFYEFAGREDKREAVRRKAAAEGERALASGERIRASQYFLLARDEARAKAVMPKVDAAAVKVPDPEKARKQLQKTDAEKEKFKKEQADLEKELGM
jgi:hypothetical protein